MEEKEYLSWKKVYNNALVLLSGRNDAIRKAADLLEVDLEFLGVTGVEDKLQREVGQVIESIRHAGIKVRFLFFSDFSL